MNTEQTHNGETRTVLCGVIRVYDVRGMCILLKAHPRKKRMYSGGQARPVISSRGRECFPGELDARGGAHTSRATAVTGQWTWVDER